MRTRTRSQRRSSMPSRRSPRFTVRLKIPQSSDGRDGRFISRRLHAQARYRATPRRLAQHPPRGTFAACFAITTSLSHHARTSRGPWPSPALPWTPMRSPACQLLFVGGRRNQPHTRRRHASASRPAGIAYEPTTRTDPTGTAPSPSPPAHRPLAPRPMNSASATAWATAGSHSARAVWITGFRPVRARDEDLGRAAPRLRRPPLLRAVRLGANVRALGVP